MAQITEACAHLACGPTSENTPHSVDRGQHGRIELFEGCYFGWTSNVGLTGQYEDSHRT
jgi:hypothetical protein